MKIAIKRVQRQAVLGYAERTQFGAKLKTFKLFSMAALALTMAACSNEDNVLENVTPAQQGTMHFTATVAAPGSGAMTRTTYTEITSGVDAGKIKVAWNEDDKISLFHNGVRDVATVTIVNTDGSATIDAPTITGSPSDNDEVKLVYPADALFWVPKLANFIPNPTVEDYILNQDGTLEFIQNNLDIRVGTSQLAVSGSDATLKTSVEMPSVIAIWKLTLTTDGSTALSATKVTVKNGSDVLAATTDISATSTVYLALSLIGSYDNLTIEATVGSDTYAYIAPGPVSVTEGNYYQSTVTMKKMKTTTLSSITTDYEAQDYEVLTGTLGSNVKISIADGAKVTLKDVNINGSGTWEDGLSAGITCAGDATIILEGDNTVKGLGSDYPGIYVPVGKTLTIMGTGKLTASSGEDGGGYRFGAGIGGGVAPDNESCGNIVIKSGTIVATGGGDMDGGVGAGIGGSVGTCGDITISGGNVTAKGGDCSAGIGGGYDDCGNITISGGTVHATGGGFNEGGAGIGSGLCSSCGDITISGGTITAQGGTSTSDEYPAAGIGGGYANVACGVITITAGVTSVTATKGAGEGGQSIGRGSNGEDITVNIDGTEYPYGISDSPYTYKP